MPNITEFDAGNLAIHPTETGVEAFATAGRRAGAFYNQAAESEARLGTEIGRAVATVGDTAVSYMDHQQINAGADHGATLFANLTDSWNKTSAGADVHDPTVAKKWREEQLEPALQQFAQGFSTQRSQDWANRFINTQREHFFTKTEADMSSMASVAVRESVTNAVTKYSNVAVSDPSSVDTSVALFKQNLDDVIAANPNIKGPDAARVRLEVAEKGARQIVQSGAMGAILNGRDPEAAAAAWSKKYPDYIDGREELQLAKAARTQAKANLVYDKQLALLQKQTAEANAHDGLNQSWSKNVHFDAATGRATIDPQLIKDAIEIPLKTNAPDAIPLARATIDWAESRQHGVDAAANDPDTMKGINELLYRPGATETDTKIAILQAATSKKLMPDTVKDYLELNTALHQGAIKDPVYEAAMKSAEQIIGTDLEGKKRFADFAMHFMQQYVDLRKTGKLDTDALTITKPDGSYDENSLIYKIMKSFMRPPEEIMMNTIAQRAGIPAGALPGLAPVAPAPPVGTIRAGKDGNYRFIGGDQYDQKNWQKI